MEDKDVDMEESDVEIEESEIDMDESEMETGMDMDTDVSEDTETDMDAEGDIDSEDDIDSDSEDPSKDDDQQQEENLLVPRQTYLAAGIHIGMKATTKQMLPFVYKIRPDGLAVMNLQLIDERIKIAAKFLAKSKKIMVVSRRNVAHVAIEKFSEIVNATPIKGRFMPGTLTNPNYSKFYEADAIVILDPLSDRQAVTEAVAARTPVVAVADTYNEVYNVDLILPANNKGIKSIATLFWLLGREILKERGDLKSDEDYAFKIEDFYRESDLRRRDDSRGSRRPFRRGGSRQGDRTRAPRRRATPNEDAESAPEKAESKPKKGAKKKADPIPSPIPNPVPGPQPDSEPEPEPEPEDEDTSAQ